MVPASATGARCKKHPEAPAGWGCGQCKAALCPDCAAEAGRGFVSRSQICCLCGGPAKPITVHRMYQVPFAERVVQAALFPLSRSGFLAIGLCALVFTMVSYGSVIFVGPALSVWFIVRGIYWGYIFATIRATGRGSRTIVAPNFSDAWDDVFMPAIRGILASAVIWAPVTIYGLVFEDQGYWYVPYLLSDPIELLFEPVPLVLVVAGIVYLPVALLCAATGLGVMDAWNPAMMASAIRRIGRDYWIAVGAIAMLAPVSFMLDRLAGLVTDLPVPFFSRWLGYALTFYVPFVVARVLGLVLFVHGEVLDWGSSSEYREPVLGPTAPRGTPPARKDRAAASGPQPPPEISLVKPAPRPIESPVEPPIEPPGKPRRTDPLFEELVDVALIEPPRRARPPPVPADARRARPRPPAMPPAPPPPPPPPMAEAHDGPPSIALPPESPPIALPPIGAVDSPPPPWPTAPSVAPVLLPATTPPPDLYLPISGIPSPIDPLLVDGVIKATRSGDGTRALRLYQSVPVWPTGVLRPVHHLKVGQAAAKARNFALAIKAFYAAANARDEVSPKAYVLLAQVYSDGLKDRERAENIYRAILDLYPGSREATYASGKLGAGGRSG